MATAAVIQLKNAMPNFIRLKHFTPVRNIMLGGGLCFAIERGELWHLPIAVLVPSVYVGYQTYAARDRVRAFIVDTPKSNEYESSGLHSWSPSGKANNGPNTATPV